MRDGSGWSSQLAAGEQAALAGVGFSPIGQVMGASVWSLNQTGRGVCGRRYTNSVRTGPALSARREPGVDGSYVGRARSQHMQSMSPLVDTFTRSRRAALSRLQTQASALGADGVVGVRLTIEPFQGSTQRSLSFVALGTAIRSGGDTHLAGPFLCDLAGRDLALLLRDGWAPTGLVMGVGAVVAHDDYRSARGRRAWLGNVEMTTFSDLATQARIDARARLNEDVRLHGGTTAVLGSVAVTVHEQICSKGNRNSGAADHLVQAVLLGTAITRFEVRDRAGQPSAHPLLRLSGRRARRPGAAPTVIDPFSHRRGQ